MPVVTLGLKSMLSDPGTRLLAFIVCPWTIPTIGVIVKYVGFGLIYVIEETTPGVQFLLLMIKEMLAL
jgi:hypothetical protein